MKRFTPIPRHEQVGRAVGLKTTVYLYDIGMIEPGDDPALGEEVRQSRRERLPACFVLWPEPAVCSAGASEHASGDEREFSATKNHEVYDPFGF